MPDSYRWVIDNRDQVARTVHDALMVGVWEAANYVLETANRRVPHETGALERSGVASVDDNQPIGMVSYDTPYAVRQHEEVTYRHDAGREAKWLERTMQREAETVAAHIARPVAQQIGD